MEMTGTLSDQWLLLIPAPAYLFSAYLVGPQLFLGQVKALPHVAACHVLPSGGSLPHSWADQLCHLQPLPSLECG